MKTIHYFYTIVSVVLLTGCTAEDDSLELEGTWNWIESSGGLAGGTETPESTGNQIILQFTADTMKKFANDSLVSSHIYTTGNYISILTNTSKPMIVYNEDFKTSVEIKDDTLRLSEECFDCYSSTYVRVTTN